MSVKIRTLLMNKIYVVNIGCFSCFYCFSCFLVFLSVFQCFFSVFSVFFCFFSLFPRLRCVGAWRSGGLGRFCQVGVMSCFLRLARFPFRPQAHVTDRASRSYTGYTARYCRVPRSGVRLGAVSPRTCGGAKLAMRTSTGRRRLSRSARTSTSKRNVDWCSSRLGA